MENNAVISVKGTQFVDGEKSETELVCQGTYEYDDEKININYIEYDADTGMKILSDLTVTDKGAVLIRDGGQNTRMEFQKGVRCVGHYELPFGGFNISTSTSVFENSLGEAGGNLRISYRLHLDRLTTTDNEIQISVRLRG